MLDSATTEKIRYEFADRPESGDAMPVADGIHWLRMPLPFSLGHINLWLLEDRDGWTIVDTGVDTEDCRNVWRETFDDVMRGRPVTRILVTHLHPDHAGLAGWLTETHDVELLMTREEYLLCRILVADTGRPAPEAGIDFYRAAGYSQKALDNYQERFGSFGRYVALLPDSYRRLQDGDLLEIGGNEWRVVIGRGHSPEHACLYCEDLNILISGDQILPTISSNISVHPTEPAANPLADWMTSLHEFKQRFPEDVLVLPAHGKPFRGAHVRLDQLIDEHNTGLVKLLGLCKEPKRAVDSFPALFKAKISGSNLMFATGESIAHLNYLLDTGQMTVSTDEDGVNWYQSES
jgi:glyoxylase-like metal-dependent hydrolase (beta-lactamase superfamily II)